MEQKMSLNSFKIDPNNFQNIFSSIIVNYLLTRSRDEYPTALHDCSLLLSDKNKVGVQLLDLMISRLNLIK